MKKMLPFFFSLFLVYFVFANHAYSQTESQTEPEPVIEEVEKVDGSQALQEIDDIEKNVNNMLKLLEELDSGQSLSKNEESSSRQAEDKTAEIDPLDRLTKPGENSKEEDTLNQEESSKKRIETANEVVRFVPEDPDSHFRLGLEYWRSQNFDKAISHFMEVVRLDPENAHAYWNLGLLSDKKNNGSDAIAYLKRAEDIYLKYNYPSYAKEAEDRLQQYYEKYHFESGGISLSE